MQKPITVDISSTDLYNEIYIPLLHNRKRYLFLMGSAGSGKSTFEAEKEIAHSYEPGRTLGVRKVKDTLKESVYAELVGVIELW